jgi:ABC-2 type transport system ATP-binding protein
MITVDRLTKHYTVPVKQSGLRGTLTHLLNRQYRTITAVNEVSFDIEPGEIVGFLGPNGAGKTTALKMLTGLIHPSSGQVKVAGYVPFQRESGFLRTITLVMGQKQQLLWDLPTMDSLRINAAVYGLSDRELRQRVGELAEMLSLERQLSQPVRKLSLGERMKAELLAALLHHPKVLFLDEPTLGLDVNAQSSVRDFLRQYNEHFQATVLLTSHYMADITALCRRVLMIYKGQLIYDGDLDALLERFSPCREVTVELTTGYPANALEPYGDLQSVDGHIAHFIVPQETLTQTISKLLANFEIVDLTVTDPPIEDVIRRVFEAGTV